jgi:hypothetical protein
LQLVALEAAVKTSTTDTHGDTRYITRPCCQEAPSLYRYWGGIGWTDDDPDDYSRQGLAFRSHDMIQTAIHCRYFQKAFGCSMSSFRRARATMGRSSSCFRTSPTGTATISATWEGDAASARSGITLRRHVVSSTVANGGRASIQRSKRLCCLTIWIRTLFLPHLIKPGATERCSRESRHTGRPNWIVGTSSSFGAL